MFNRAKLPLLLLFGLILGMGLGFVLYRAAGDLLRSPLLPQQETPTVPQVGVSLGQAAPAFELPGMDGETRRLSDYLGTPVVINFWATWCTPCRLEMPVLQERQNLYDDRLAILAINASESEKQITPFIEELGLTLEVLRDTDGAVQRDYLVIGLPVTYFLDNDGIIRAQHIGIMTATQIDDYLAIIGVTP